MPSLILTRTAEDNLRVTPEFEAQGFTVYSVPMLELRPLPKDERGLKALTRLVGNEPVLLTSSYATELWLELRKDEFKDHVPESYIVVGQTSERLLREREPHVPIRLVMNFAVELLKTDLNDIDSILYPCSTERREEMVEGLRQLGIRVVTLPLYAPAPTTMTTEELNAIIARVERPITFTFFSPSAVRNFFSLSPDIPSDAIFAAVGRTTASALEERGITDVTVAGVPGSSQLADKLNRS